MISLTSIMKHRTNQSTELLDRCIYELSDKKIEAMTALYQSTSVSVYSFALSILKNSQDAEDVLHDSYITIYSAASSYQSAGKPMAWILTITKNLCLRKIQKRKLTVDIPQADWENHLGNTAGLSVEDKIIITGCMNILSDQERQVVILHAVSGFKHREIAKMLELPLPTVLSKYYRATKKMRKHLLGKENRIYETN